MIRRNTEPEMSEKNPAIEGQTIVKCAIPTVFEFVNDPLTFALWLAPIKEVVMLTEGAVDVGSKFYMKSNYLGRDFEGESCIEKHIPNKAIICKTQYGKLAFRQRVSLLPAPEGTQITLGIEADTTGMNRFQLKFQELILNKMNREFSTNLSNLRTILEQKATPVSS